jgi:hypothetical protein
MSSSQGLGFWVEEGASKRGHSDRVGYSLQRTHYHFGYEQVLEAGTCNAGAGGLKAGDTCRAMPNRISFYFLTICYP